MYCRMCGVQLTDNEEYCPECKIQVHNEKRVVKFNAFPIALISMIATIVTPSLLSFVISLDKTIQDNIGVNAALFSMGLLCLSCGIISICFSSSMRKNKMSKSTATLIMAIVTVVYSSFIVSQNIRPFIEMIKDNISSTGTIL